MNDPVVARLDEALADARQKLMQVISAGEIPAESLRMLVEVRQDLVFMSREVLTHRIEIHDRIDELDAKKVDKNPNTIWLYRTMIGTALATVFGFLAWLVQGGHS